MIITSHTVMGNPTEVELPPIHVERGSLNRQLTMFLHHDQKIHFLDNYITYCNSKMNMAIVQGKEKVEAYFIACKQAAKDIKSKEINKHEEES